MFDVLIIGGGAAGLSCALILGSALPKDYAKNKRVAIFTHQKSSHLQNAKFYNVLGLASGTSGASILHDGKLQLAENYPDVIQIDNEKVLELTQTESGFNIKTNKNQYTSKCIVVAVGYTNLLTIKGLEDYIEPHPRENPEKNRIWLKNTNHLITEDLYVAGTLAGWRSQYAIACGSGAQVATDILTEWNNGKHSKVHDKINLL